MALGSFPWRPFASGKAMRVPHPIPYQGSKRNLASAILGYFPANVAVLIEPFAGSAAVTLAAAARGLAERYVINDLNRPLVELWLAIIESPEKLARQYETLWRAQHENRRRYYDEVRDDFNRTGRPECLLYLLARCVKAAVRYNANGQFNQSPDNRRMGALPETMRAHILGAARSAAGQDQVPLARLRGRGGPGDAGRLDLHGSAVPGCLRRARPALSARAWCTMNSSRSSNRSIAATSGIWSATTGGRAGESMGANCLSTCGCA